MATKTRSAMKFDMEIELLLSQERKSTKNNGESSPYSAFRHRNNLDTISNSTPKRLTEDRPRPRKMPTLMVESDKIQEEGTSPTRRAATDATTGHRSQSPRRTRDTSFGALGKSLENYPQRNKGTNISTFGKSAQKSSFQEKKIHHQSNQMLRDVII